MPGWLCGHAINLSWPLLPASMKRFSAGYEGELMLTASAPLSTLRVLRPAPQRRIGDEWETLADAATTAELARILPRSDLALKGKAYGTCAVVGGSGSLLLRRLGPAIDAHTLVMRVGVTPSRGFEASLGSKTNLRFSGDDDWGWHEHDSDLVLVRTQSRRTIEVGLRIGEWNCFPSGCAV